MNYIESIILGLIQGLTEFLPVSSSAHIVLTDAVYDAFTGAHLPNGNPEEVFFDILLHIGTLIAVFIYFKKEIFTLLKAFFVAIKTRDFSSYEAKICLYILLGTVVTAVVALPLEGITEELVKFPHIVGLLLIGTGFVLFFSEKIAKKFSKDKEKVDLKKSIFIGIAQGLAVFPGFSRSGLTIATGLACGLTRVKAAKYSFLLSFPIIFGISLVYPIKEFGLLQISSFNWGPLFCGFLVSTIVGYLCIKYFIIYLVKFSLNCFAYYCWIVGALAAILFNPMFHLITL